MNDLSFAIPPPRPPRVFLFLAALAGCGGAPAAAPAAPAAAATPAAAAPGPVAPLSPAAIQALVADPDRTPKDREIDAGRHPAELLAFSGVGPGMTVGEIVSAGGYTTELLARAVGPTGKVYGENPPALLAKFAEKPWSERLLRPAMKNVVRADREVDDPFPPEAKGLDAVFIVLFYHDTVWMKTDRDRMNHAVFDALRPGGVYVIVDHSGRAGTGTTEAQTLHRIEEKVVREEVERAGFKLAAAGDFLRNTADTRDWNASPKAAAEKRGTSDRFVLEYQKP
jgi:predicted methyltransferase